MYSVLAKGIDDKLYSNSFNDMNDANKTYNMFCNLQNIKTVSYFKNGVIIKKFER